MYIFDVCTSYVHILYSLDILLKIICLISKAKKKKELKLREILALLALGLTELSYSIEFFPIVEICVALPNRDPNEVDFSFFLRGWRWEALLCRKC